MVYWIAHYTKNQVPNSTSHPLVPIHLPWVSQFLLVCTILRPTLHRQLIRKPIDTQVLQWFVVVVVLQSTISFQNSKSINDSVSPNNLVALSIHVAGLTWSHLKPCDSIPTVQGFVVNSKPGVSSHLVHLIDSLVYSTLPIERHNHHLYHRTTTLPNQNQLKIQYPY